MVEVTYQMVLSTLQTAGLLVGIYYYIFIMRNSQKTRELSLKAQEQALEARQIQIFMQFNEKLTENQDVFFEIMGGYSDKGWSWSDIDDFMQKYGPESNPEEWMKLISICDMFEQTGVLAKYDSVNVHLIYDLMGDYPIDFWDKFEEIIDYTRVKMGLPIGLTWFEYFEDLVYMLRDAREYDIRDLENRLMRRRTRKQELGKTMPETA